MNPDQIHYTIAALKSAEDTLAQSAPAALTLVRDELSLVRRVILAQRKKEPPLCTLCTAAVHPGPASGPASQPASPDPHPIAIILNAVADNTGITVAALTGSRGDRTTTEYRHMAVYLCHQMLGLSLMATGRAFNRHHTRTVLSSLKRARELMEIDPHYAATVRRLREQLRPRIGDVRAPQTSNPNP